LTTDNTTCESRGGRNAGPTRERILVADDDRLILATIASGLRRAGYEVMEAVDGEQAIRLCREKKPDLALLDIRMPGLSGIEAVQWLRRDPDTNIPVLFISAYGDESLVDEAVAEGAFGYLLKPLDVVQILPPIRAALARAAESERLRR